jgi:hypothetical protein
MPVPEPGVWNSPCQGWDHSCKKHGGSHQSMHACAVATTINRAQKAYHEALEDSRENGKNEHITMKDKKSWYMDREDDARCMHQSCMPTKKKWILYRVPRNDNVCFFVDGKNLKTKKTRERESPVVRSFVILRMMMMGGWVGQQQHSRKQTQNDRFEEMGNIQSNRVEQFFLQAFSFGKKKSIMYVSHREPRLTLGKLLSNCM